MNTKTNENLAKILKMTGLTHEEFNQRLDVALLEHELGDAHYKSLTDYCGNDYAGESVNDWLAGISVKDFTVICEKIVKHTPCKLNRIVLVLPGVVMMGDGDCPECGRDAIETGYHEGEWLGDGYYQPKEFTGSIEMKCEYCSHIFDKEI